MPIVLAIEPDHKQAAHLAAIVRHLVGVDLVLAHTTEGALDAIGNRVPDLVLVPALLSPQDDAALAAALRVIAAAAHVRTLTIPVLASGVTHAPSGGLLSKWRKSRAAAPEPEGCAPAVFGEQITAYLQEAAAERAALAELEDDPLERGPLHAHVSMAAPAPVIVAEAPVEVVETFAALDAVDAPVEISMAATTIDAVVNEEDVTAADREEPHDAGAAEDEPDDALIDLSDELAELSGEGDGELFDGERVGVYTISAEADEPSLDTFDLLPEILDAPATPAPVAAAVVEHTEIAAPAPVEAARLFDTDPWETPRADITPWEPMYLTPGRMWPPIEGMPAEMPVARSEQPDWIELVASLRQDLERRRMEAPSSGADPIAARPSDGAHAAVHQLSKKARPVKKAKPVQDEWGFFDPEQCGFSTLLAKLEEITDEGAGV